MGKATEKRRKEIYQILLEQNTMRVKDLSAKMQVSLETIRKDLNSMETQGLLIRRHGKAEVRKQYDQLPVNVKASENIFAKQLIARVAIEHIPDNCILYLDPSTTNLYIAKLLRLKKSLTIITNSLAIASVVSESGHALLIAGGMLSQKSKAILGAFATQMISTMQIDIAIMGSDGFLKANGPTTFAYEEIDIKQQIMQRAKKKILLCDSSKFTKSSPYEYAPFLAFDLFITDMPVIDDKHPCHAAKKIIIAKETT